jgi:hypothetical protein
MRKSVLVIVFNTVCMCMNVCTGVLAVWTSGQRQIHHGCEVPALLVPGDANIDNKYM